MKNIDLNNMHFFEVEKDERIILTKALLPQKGTLDYLHKDYKSPSFQTELIDLGEPVGNEQW